MSIVVWTQGASHMTVTACLLAEHWYYLCVIVLVIELYIGSYIEWKTGCFGA
jgi:hypothetical protein